MIKINKTSAEMSFYFMEFASLHAPIAFNMCFLDFSRYYSNMIFFLNNSRLYFNPIVVGLFYSTIFFGGGGKRAPLPNS